MPTDKVLAKNVKMRDDYAADQLDKHLETFDFNNPRDFIDAYFSAMTRKIKRNEASTFEGKDLCFSKEYFKWSCVRKFIRKKYFSLS